MATITTTFETIRRSVTKARRCTACNKVKKQSATFTQTLNPYNVNSLGVPKTRYEIERELDQKCQSWEPKPYCGCVERKERDDRPEKRTTDVPFGTGGPHIDNLISAAQELADKLKIIEDEIKARTVGAAITEVDSKGELREGFITEVFIDTSWNKQVSVKCLTWQASKRDPKIGVNVDNNRYYRDIKTVTFSRSPEQSKV